MAKEQFVAMWRVLALCIFISWHLEWLVKWQGTEYHRKNVLIVFLCFVLTKKRDNWFFWKNETFRVFFLYFIHSPPPPVIMNIAWCSHHSIYIRTVMPCPSMGPKWFWTNQIILVEYQLFWTGPIRFGWVQIILVRSKL